MEEITHAIESLPADDVARVQSWLAEYAEQPWEQIERDEAADRLDPLIDRATEEHRSGRNLPCRRSTESWSDACGAR